MHMFYRLAHFAIVSPVIHYIAALISFSIIGCKYFSKFSLTLCWLIGCYWFLLILNWTSVCYIILFCCLLMLTFGCVLRVMVWKFYRFYFLNSFTSIDMVFRLILDCLFSIILMLLIPGFLLNLLFVLIFQ